jgi:ferredoxin
VSHRFTARCDGCTACARQCPTGAITGRMHERHAVIAALCIDCGVCGWICHAGAVDDQHGQVVARLARDQRPRPVVVADRCNGCGLCVDYCPTACLQVIGRAHAGIAVLAQPLACVSCGECADICEKGAVLMGPLDLRSFDAEVERARLAAILEEDR